MQENIIYHRCNWSDFYFLRKPNTAPKEPWCSHKRRPRSLPGLAREKKSIKRRREQQNNKDFWRPHKINDARTQTQVQKQKENNLKFYVRTEMQSEDSGSTRQKGNRKNGLKQLNKWLYFEPRANIQNWIERINVIILFTPQVQDCISLFVFFSSCLVLRPLRMLIECASQVETKETVDVLKQKWMSSFLGNFFGGEYTQI